MTWLQRYRIRNYLRRSIWAPPLLGIALALSTAFALTRLENGSGFDSAIDPGAARSLLETLAASMFTLIVFVSSTLLLALQLASAQLTPRVISLVFKDTVTKLALTLFVFTFTFALAVAIRINSGVPILSTRIAAYSCLLSLVFFIFLVDHVGNFLRPSGVLRTVGLIGRRVIEEVFPHRFGESDGVEPSPGIDPTEEPSRTIASTRSGVVLALNVRGLVALAQRSDCVIEVIPQVGDFVAVDEPFFRIYRGGTSIVPDALHDSVAVGPERTFEQDPAFVFRIIVDIASKGLSPAINDPTTAVLAIDQVHRMLRYVGTRRLDNGRVRDASGRIRLLYPTPGWGEFVQLAVTEIRHFGASSIQVARRLRAMLENLIHTLPPQRTALLVQELGRLERSARRYFHESDDQAMAEVSDSQGVGGKHRSDSPSRNGGSA